MSNFFEKLLGYAAKAFNHIEWLHSQRNDSDELRRFKNWEWRAIVSFSAAPFLTLLGFVISGLAAPSPDFSAARIVNDALVPLIGRGVYLLSALAFTCGGVCLLLAVRTVAQCHREK